jgi:hypothetical protein
MKLEASKKKKLEDEIMLADEILSTFNYAIHNDPDFPMANDIADLKVLHRKIGLIITELDPEETNVQFPFLASVFNSVRQELALAKTTLRPVEYTVYDFNNRRKTERGQLHLIFIRMMDEGDQMPLALIEGEDGSLMEVEVRRVKFLDHRSPG